MRSDASLHSIAQFINFMTKYFLLSNQETKKFYGYTILTQPCPLKSRTAAKKGVSSIVKKRLV